MKRKLLSLALALVMCLGLLPMSALAADITCTEVTPLVYDKADNFTGGLAAVKRDGKWSLIDKTGREILTLEKDYDYVYIKPDGFLEVCINGVEVNGWGLLDMTGREVVPCKYDYIKDFSEDLAAVRLGDVYSGKWGFIDRTGKEVVPCIYGDVRDFSDGVASVQQGPPASSTWGVIDKTGREIIPCEQTSVAFSEGLAWIEVMQDDGSVKYTYVDKTGKEAVPVKPDHSPNGDFSEGLACVALGEGADYRSGYIDKTGKLVLELKPGQFGFSFFEGLAVVSSREEKCGVIDKTGREIVPCKYDNMFNPIINDLGFHEGVAQVELNGKYGYIDKTGREIVPCRYDSVGDFYEGLVEVELNGKYGFVDTTGKEVVPCKYDCAWFFSDGLAKVQLNSKYGYIDKTGREVVPLQYDDASIFSEGLAPVMMNGKWGYISVNADSTAPQPVGDKTANPSSDRLTVNGVAGNPTVYNIDNSNYFKLRDVAALLNGTEKQFSVGYDGEKQSVTAATGQGYDKLPTDLAGPPAGPGKAKVSHNAIYVDGVKIKAEVYNINDNNYFKLRDLGKELNFYVGWTLERGIYIETDKPYEG